jgi:two-component system CheB/CheR fusion protein
LSEASPAPGGEVHATPAGPPSNFEGRLIAIGASAGGLDALERLFGHLPADTGAAFVVVQHLSPDHKSMMDNLLSRYTSMPVRVVQDGDALQANQVLLIPPGTTLRLAGHHLQLTPKAAHGLSLPIDDFFSSAAESLGDRCIAVVLSGTGSDGSRGAVAVNAASGFVYVQAPDDARFDGMPRAAIAANVADVVAAIPELAERLLQRLQAPLGSVLPTVPDPAPSLLLLTPLDGILALLRTASGIDFRDYKPSTVLRRIERRMQVHNAPSLEAYLAHLQQHPPELALLRREMLIPVTRFFRDPEAFDDLARTVVPSLLQHAGNEGIRCWVACCATGEEAYSLAMLFAEAMRRQGRVLPVKIFATDAEPAYLEQAARGEYPATIASEVGQERLHRYFLERGSMWVVTPEVRQMVIFARHNVVADPPFTRMNLVTCRNALIYMQPATQDQALRRLQYALVQGGHLMLGPSESLGNSHRDFLSLPGRHKLFLLTRRERIPFSMDGSSRQPALGGLRSTVRAPVAPEPSSNERVEAGLSLLRQRYLPLALLVSETRELLHVYGDAHHYLRIHPGQPTLDVLKLLPRELGWATSLLLQTVLEQRTEQRSPRLSLATEGGHESVQLVACLLETPEAAPAVLLMFESAPAAPAPDAAGVKTTAEDATPSEALRAGMLSQLQRIEALERELSLTHHSLQSTIEELETANEELQATNEELMASNEELQSTNEELQSVNEELYTVNAEYQEKVDILNAVNADLENVSLAAAIPTLFVDDKLVLTRFTPEAAQLFKVREGDVGRSLEDFANQLDYPQLFHDLRETLASNRATEREVQSRNGDWWLARVQPYLSRGHTQGSRAVMTFVNISSLKDSQRLQAVLDSMAANVAVLDPHGTITLVNAAWRDFALANGDPALKSTGPGSNYLTTCASAALVDEDARQAYEGLNAVLQGERESFSLQYPCHSPTQRRWFLMQAATLLPRGGAVVSHTDVTAGVEAMLQRRTEEPLP